MVEKEELIAEAYKLLGIEENKKDILTAKTGFHTSKIVGKDKEGNDRIVQVPVYKDLREYFERKFHYKNLGASGITYIWHNDHYVVYPDCYIEHFAQVHFDPYADTKKTVEFRKLIQRTNLYDIDWFDETTQKKINFKNGVLDIDTGLFSPHDPKYGFRYVLEYDYEPNSTCPVFDKALNDVTVNDESLKQILLEFSGYCLSSDACWAHKALILEGSGSNGKSTFMNCLRSLAGHANYTSLTLHDVQDARKCQLLDGKLFNLAEETPSKGLMDSSIFKNLVTGGETIVEQKYKNAYVMRNRAKMIFACNELPDTYDTSKGFIRRFIIVPFRAVFDAKDPNFDPFIDEKLIKERSGIFNKVYSAYKILKERGAFITSDLVNKAVSDYENEINPLVEWCANNLIIEPVGNGHDGMALPIAEIYTEFCKQQEKLGYTPINIKLFGRKLRAIIPDISDRKFTKHEGSEAKKALKAVGWNPDVFERRRREAAEHKIKPRYYHS